jgi:hypothetical protein
MPIEEKVKCGMMDISKDITREPLGPFAFDSSTIESSESDPLIEKILECFFRFAKSSLKDDVFKKEVHFLSSIYEDLVSFLVRSGTNQSLLEVCRSFLILRNIIEVCDTASDDDREYVIDRYCQKYERKILPLTILRMLAIGLESMNSDLDQDTENLVNSALKALRIYYARYNVEMRITPLIDNCLRCPPEKNNLLRRIGLDEKDIRLSLMKLRVQIKNSACLQEFFGLSPSDIVYSSKTTYLQPLLQSRIQSEKLMNETRKKIQKSQKGQPVSLVCLDDIDARLDDVEILQAADADANYVCRDIWGSITKWHAQGAPLEKTN